MSVMISLSDLGSVEEHACGFLDERAYEDVDKQVYGFIEKQACEAVNGRIHSGAVAEDLP